MLARHCVVPREHEDGLQKQEERRWWWRGSQAEQDMIPTGELITKVLCKYVSKTSALGLFYHMYYYSIVDCTTLERDGHEGSVQVYVRDERFGFMIQFFYYRYLFATSSSTLRWALKYTPQSQKRCIGLLSPRKNHKTFTSSHGPTVHHAANHLICHPTNHATDPCEEGSSSRRSSDRSCPWGRHC
jgi:hypothetical protein